MGSAQVKIQQIKKFILHLLTYIARPLCTPIDMKILPNIEKYVCKLLVKFQSNSTLKLKIMLYSMKLDNRHINARIRISLFNIFFDRIRVINLSQYQIYNL
jgi:hypothetical protein